MTVIVQDFVTRNVLEVVTSEETNASKLQKGDSFGKYQIVKVEDKKSHVILFVDHVLTKGNKGKALFLSYLQEIIKERKGRKGDDDKSYTTKLFKKGINKIAQKVGEEAVEVVIEALVKNKKLLIEEASDLLFHLIVLFEASDVDLDEVIECLMDRHKK